MIHRFVSFYMNNLKPEVLTIQKEVFKKFGVDIEQRLFSGYHSKAIESFLNNDKNYDLITILDVDCVPYNNTFLQKIYDNVTDDNTLYGNAQSSNTYPHNIHKSPPFVAPSFLNFKRELYETSNYKNFDFTLYPNPEGVKVEADVAEVFTRENEKQGRVIKLGYPLRSLKVQEWEYTGCYGFKPFKFGVGTEFESGMYHNFQIRSWEAQEMFINYCRYILDEN